MLPPMPALPAPVIALATRQSGLATRSQLLACGLSRRQVDRLGAPDGRGRRVLPRVYALTTGPLTRRQQLVAALLYCGPEAQLAGPTALELRGFRYAPSDPQVHVLLPMRRQVRAVGFVRVRRTVDLPTPHRVDGLALSPVDRAAVDAARAMRSTRDALAVLAEAVQRRTTTLALLQAELERGPQRGSGAARRALQLLGTGAASAPESDLVRLVSRSLLLPPPLVNRPLTVGGALRAADLRWPEARLVVEVDSVDHHGFGWTPEYTSRRRAALVAEGWTVLSISPARIRDDPDGVLRDIEAAYLAGVQLTAG